MDPFAEMYEKYQPDVYRFLLYLSGCDHDAAEELTQECCICRPQNRTCTG